MFHFKFLAQSQPQWGEILVDNLPCTLQVPGMSPAEPESALTECHCFRVALSQSHALCNCRWHLLGWRAAPGNPWALLPVQFQALACLTHSPRRKRAIGAKSKVIAKIKLRGLVQVHSEDWDGCRDWTGVEVKCLSSWIMKWQMPLFVVSYFFFFRCLIAFWFCHSCDLERIIHTLASRDPSYLNIDQSSPSYVVYAVFFAIAN